MRFYPRNAKSRRDAVAGKSHLGQHMEGDVKTAQDRSARYGKAFAAGTLVSTQNYADTETITVGGVTYTLQSTLVDAANNIKIGASEALTLANIANAINASGGTPGTDYGTATVANPDARAAQDATHTVTLTARKKGKYGNTIPLSTTAAHTTASGSVLSGGY